MGGLDTLDDRMDRRKYRQMEGRERKELLPLKTGKRESVREKQRQRRIQRDRYR